LFVLRYLLLAIAFLGSAWTQEIKVAAAADLSAPMQKITDAFQKETGIHVVVSLGSSGNFFAQLQNGAPFDVFLSADRSYPEKLQEAGLAEAPVLYARGKLVIWIPNRLDLKLSPDNVKILSSPAVSKISIANPQHAPYGRAAMEALRNAGIEPQVHERVITAENVRQALIYAQSGDADVALVARSLVSPNEGRLTEVAPTLYSPILQGAATLRSGQTANANRFVDFLCGRDGQEILSRYGFDKRLDETKSPATQSQKSAP